jgi:hypothetical protein
MVVNEELLVVPRADALRIPPREQRPRNVYVRGGTGLLTASCVDGKIRLLVIDHPFSSNEESPRGRVAAASPGVSSLASSKEPRDAA